MALTLRDYEPGDEEGWLRCRVLSFLHTAYYDATTIEAYTRDDAQALVWYRAQNLTESEHYLHVYANLYADPAEPKRAIASARLGLEPVVVFSHHTLEQEAELRQQFRRVHVCRRFSRTL